MSEITGKCRRCGCVLSDRESIERGYGPDCWALLENDRAELRRLTIEHERRQEQTRLALGSMRRLVVQGAYLVDAETGEVVRLARSRIRRSR
jgi:hypothetical protein